MQSILAFEVRLRTKGNTIASQLEDLVKKINEQNLWVIQIIPPPDIAAGALSCEYSFLCEPFAK